MNRLSLLAAGAALSLLGMASAAPHGVGSTYHGKGPSPFTGMPPHGFHGIPPSFHGALPHGSRIHHGPYNFGLFHGRPYSHFSMGDHEGWRRGSWRHAWHNGHYGWWWLAGGAWFYYPEPIYPYPLYVGPEYYYDYYQDYGTPDHYWYYCDDPEGYYPNVRHCNNAWQVVPPAPGD